MLEKILVDLKVISRLTENDKLCTVNADNITIESNDYLQATRRYMYNDSRSRTIKTIDNIIDSSVEYSTNCMKSSHLNLHQLTNSPSEHDRENHFRECTKLRNLSIEINNTVKGLNNLKLTYRNDAIITSQIDVIIHKINTHVSEIEKKIEQVSPNNNKS